jgi:hypothetical protein
MFDRVKKWFRSLRGWQLVWDTGIWRYEENTVTGDRFAYRHGRGWERVNRDWVEDVPPGARWTVVNEWGSYGTIELEP